MSFNNIFFSIISEAVQSEKLQKLINAIKEQYNKETESSKVSVLKGLCEKISKITSTYLHDPTSNIKNKKERMVLFALSDFSNELFKIAEEHAKTVTKEISEKEAFLTIIVPAVEEEYGVSVDKDAIKFIIENLSDTKRNFHEESKQQKRLLTRLFKEIDASAISDEDVVEASSLNEFSRKTKGTYSIIACFYKSKLNAIIYFNDDGTLNYIENFAGYRYGKATMKTLNDNCDRFIAVKRSKDAITKTSQRFTNAEYSRSKSDDEQRAENMRRYQQIKQDKINEKRVKDQQSRIAKALADAKEAIKTYDPEFDTFEAIEIIRTYKKLKGYVNSSFESGYANEYMSIIEKNIQKLKENAGVAE